MGGELWLAQRCPSYAEGAAKQSQQDYRLAIEEGPFEVREYPPFVSLDVRVMGNRDWAAAVGLVLLMAYARGANTRCVGSSETGSSGGSRQIGERIALTPPLIQAGRGENWTMSVSLPRSYSLATAPSPSHPRVRLKAVAATWYAVTRFPAFCDAYEIACRTSQLRRFVASQGLSVEASPAIARYVPPWQIASGRRDEIMLCLEG